MLIATNRFNLDLLRALVEIRRNHRRYAQTFVILVQRAHRIGLRHIVAHEFGNRVCDRARVVRRVDAD